MVLMSPYFTTNKVNPYGINESEFNDYLNTNPQGDLIGLRQSIYGQAPLGTDLTDTVARFNAWRAKKADAQRVNEEYLKLAKDQPGRDATILTQKDMNKTILGGMGSR